MRTRWKQWIAAALVGAAVCTSITGCAGTEQTQQESVNTVTFTDSLGREVEVPENITSYAVTGPLAQIVMFALAPDEMAAIASEWSIEAEEFLDEKYYNLPILGQLYGGDGDLNLEELMNANPQVIIDVGESKEDIGEDMDSIQEQSGIPVVHIAADLSTMAEAYEMLGGLMGKEEEAAVLSDYCTEVYDRTVAIAEEVGEDKPTVLYCQGDLGCNVICKDSYHSEVIDLLTDNQAIVENPSSKGIGNEVDFEQILLWDPEVIFFAPDSMFDYVEDDPLWEQLQAIQSGNYYEVPYGPYNWMGFPPSAQRYLGMMWMAKVLYPETADYDLYEETARYFELFYHCALTEEQYDTLVENSIGKME